MLQDKLAQLKALVSSPEFKAALVQQIVISVAVTTVSVVTGYVLKSVVIPGVTEALNNLNSPETIETQI